MIGPGTQLDRRTFLGGVGAAGALALGPWRAAAAVLEPPRKRVRLALKYGMIEGGETIAEKFAIARDAGFEGVELLSPNDFAVEDVLAAKEKTGIEIPGVVDSVHWHTTLSDPDPRVRSDARHALETALLDCKEYGGTSVLLVPAVVNAKVSYEDAYRRSQEAIKRVLPLAFEVNVSIAIENVWNNFLLSPLEAARYVDEVGSAPGGRAYVLNTERIDEDNRLHTSRRRLVGWHFDVGNIVKYGWPDQWIRTLGDRVLKLDVKGYSHEKGFDVPIGEGDVDWAAVRTALDDIDYHGWAAAEVRGGDGKRLAEIAHRMNAVLNPSE